MSWFTQTFGIEKRKKEQEIKSEYADIAKKIANEPVAQTNLTPIFVLGGVAIVGTIMFVYFTRRRKKPQTNSS